MGGVVRSVWGILSSGMGTLCLNQCGNQKLTLPTTPVPLHRTSSAEGCAEPVGGVMLGSVHVLFMFVVVCTGLHWFALVAVGLHCRWSLFTMILKYTVAYARVYTPLWSCTLNFLRVDLHGYTSLYVCMKVQS